MPKPMDVCEIFAVGTISGVQGWSTGLSVHIVPSSGSWLLAQMTGWVAAQRAFFDTWWTTIKTSNSPQVAYTGVKAFFYGGTTGKVTQSASSATGPIAGTGTSNFHPSYTSVVISQRTAHPGRQGRGRSYCPLTSATLTSSNLQLANGDIVQIAGAYLALLNSINAYTSAPNNIASQEVCVASWAGNMKNRVNTFIIDSIVDVQHRREDKLLPAIVNATVVP